MIYNSLQLLPPCNPSQPESANSCRTRSIDESTCQIAHNPKDLKGLVSSDTVTLSISRMLNTSMTRVFPYFGSNPPGTTSPIILAVVSGLLVLCTSYLLFARHKPTAIYELGGLSIFNAWTFFGKRYDFLISNFERTGHAMFSFNVLHVSFSLARIFLLT